MDLLTCNKPKLAFIAWKHILDQKNLIRKGIIWVSENGKSFIFWYDS